MTERDRVIESLRHSQTGKVPFDIQFTRPAREKMADFYGGISTQRLLPFGTVDQVRDQVPPPAGRVGA